MHLSFQASIRAVSEGWRTLNLKSIQEKRRQENPALRLPAGRNGQFKTK